MSEVQAKERRLLSPQAGVAGPMRTRVLQRDLLQREQLAWIFTFAQAEVFRVWWQDVLIYGGCWFGAHWPLPQGVPDGGYRFRRFVGAPTWSEFIPGVGWAVSAVCEVRGLGTPEVIDGGAPPPPPLPTVEWDAARSSTTAVFTNGGLTAESTLSPGKYVNIITTGGGEIAGKFYYEFLIDVTNGLSNRWPSFGIVTNDYWVEGDGDGNAPVVELGGYGWGFRLTGEVAGAGSMDPLFASPPMVAGSVAGIAVDLDAGRLWVSHNGVFVGDPAAGTGATFTDLRTRSGFPVSASNPAFPSSSLSANAGGAKLTARFAASSWTYPAPTGFGPWVA